MATAVEERMFQLKEAKRKLDHRKRHFETVIKTFVFISNAEHNTGWQVVGKPTDTLLATFEGHKYLLSMKPRLNADRTKFSFDRVEQVDGQYRPVQNIAKVYCEPTTGDLYAEPDRGQQHISAVYDDELLSLLLLGWQLEAVRNLPE